MLHQEVAGSKLGRSIFPLLLILIPLVADAGIVACQAGTCPSAPTFDSADTRPAGSDFPLEFPFGPGSTFSSADPGVVSLDSETGVADEREEAASQEAQAAPAGGTSSAARRPVTSAASPQQAVASDQVSAPFALSVPAIPSVPPPTTGERAAREYRSYSPPPDRRTYSSHPDAGGAGFDSSFGLPAAGSPANATPPTSTATAPPAPPPPPPPGSQGSPGGFSPGQPGDPAGFIG